MNEEVAGAVTEETAETGNQQATASQFVLLDDILSDAQDSDAEIQEADGSGADSENAGETGDSIPAKEPEPVESQNQPVTYRTQAEFDAAFTKRMAKERQRNKPYLDVGHLVDDVTGGELTEDEIRAAVSNALAEKRSRDNKTDFDTEINNIRVEQRIKSKIKPKEEPSEQQEPQVSERVAEMVGAIQAIGDDAFTIEALRNNQSAMVEWANGATPAQIYRKFFANGGKQTIPKTGGKRPAPERSANSGAVGTVSRELTDKEMARIDEQIAKGFDVRVI